MRESKILHIINKRGRGNAARMIAVFVLIAIVGLGGWKIISNRQGSSKAVSVMTTLQQIIPDLGVDTGTSGGIGRDPLAALSVNGIDIVGVLEVPALNINAPVTGQSYSEEFFATWLVGSPVQGHFQVVGGRDDLFRNLAKLKPGDLVFFTDVDGVRYRYEVTTQYHLKKWDTGENDLQLCYETDKDTYFVVGCGAAEK